MCRFVFRNRPFYSLKRTILHSKTACFAMRNDRAHAVPSSFVKIVYCHKAIAAHRRHMPQCLAPCRLHGKNVLVFCR